MKGLKQAVNFLLKVSCVNIMHSFAALLCLAKSIALWLLWRISDCVPSKPCALRTCSRSLFAL